jgi:hypothetical protein
MSNPTCTETPVPETTETTAETPNPAKTAAKGPKKAPKMLPVEYKPEFRISMMVTSSVDPALLYEVTHGTYGGNPHPHGWSCTCPDYHYRHSLKGTHCKHIVGVLAQLSPAVVGALLGNPVGNEAQAEAAGT